MTVLRDGEYVGEHADRDDTRSTTIISMMVGRELARRSPKDAQAARRGRARRSRACTRGPLVHDVSFDLRKRRNPRLRRPGGRRTHRSRARGVRRRRRRPRARSCIDGKKIAIRTPGTRVAAGIGFLTEDRKRYRPRSCASTSIANVQMAHLRRLHSRCGFVQRAAGSRRCAASTSSCSSDRARPSLEPADIDCSRAAISRRS